MKKLTILVDMDDTIDNLCQTWVAYLNKQFGTCVRHDDITEWDMAKAFPMLTPHQIYRPLDDPALWDRVLPIDGAQYTLRKLLSDGHRVFIVTSSDYRTLDMKMERVLFQYFPFLSWDDVIVTSRKQLICGDVLIDDAVHNLEGGRYQKLLMDAPHNRQYPVEENGMVRVKTWDDIYRAIQELTKV